MECLLIFLLQRCIFSSRFLDSVHSVESVCVFLVICVYEWSFFCPGECHGMVSCADSCVCTADSALFASPGYVKCLQDLALVIGFPNSLCALLYSGMGSLPSPSFFHYVQCLPISMFLLWDDCLMFVCVCVFCST